LRRQPIELGDPHRIIVRQLLSGRRDRQQQESKNSTHTI